MGNCSHHHHHDHDHDHSHEEVELKEAKDGHIESVYKVSGMDCADEIKAITRSLEMPNVSRVEAHLMTETVKVWHDQKLEQKDLIKAINKAGVKVVEKGAGNILNLHRKRILTVILSGVFLIAGLVLHWTNAPYETIKMISYALSMIFSGSLVVPTALRAMKQFSLDINVLMFVAILGAVIIKEYSEAASVIFLFSLAELLEALSVSRARRAIQEVLNLTPKTATILENGVERVIEVEKLELGQTLLIKPGDNIPTDGIIIEGKTDIDQASLTGEANLVQKIENDEVLAGTTNITGLLKVKVSKLFNETKVSKIISLIEEAQNQKAPSQRFVDKFARIYTPAILILAIFVAIIPPLFMGGDFDTWFYRSLVFLVIGCPCALVIATPVSVVSGITSLARRGVLLKGGVYLEELGKIKAIAVDKTGTITLGKPELKAFKNFSNISETELFKITASLESASTHPLALALIDEAKKRNVSYTTPRDYKVLPGLGAEGSLDGKKFFIGNHKLAHSLQSCRPETEEYLKEQEDAGHTIVILGSIEEKTIYGIFSLGDQIRPEAQEAIKNLHAIGVKNIAMLSGDHQQSVDKIAKLVGIDEAIGALLPDGKVENIKRLSNQYKHVAMIGDGINDAPALAHANIGIAMGVAGSDTAIETADVALMQDNLLELPKAIYQARRALNIIRFNISFAIGIKIVFFVLTFMGYSNLWLAVAADMGASLLVTFNALRLLRIKA